MESSFRSSAEVRAELGSAADELAAASGNERAERGDTRERILKAATARFVAYGYHGTSVRDLARDVGITPAGLYSHFASKEQLLSVTLTKGYASFLHEIVLPAIGEDAREQLLGILLRHWERVDQDPASVRFFNDQLRGGLIEVPDAELRSLLRRSASLHLEIVSQLVRELREALAITDSVDARAIAEALMALAETQVATASERSSLGGGDAEVRRALLERILRL